MKIRINYLIIFPLLFIYVLSQALEVVFISTRATIKLLPA